MRLKNVLIVVKDVEKAKQFYHDLFGLDVVADSGGTVILTEGLVLQDEGIWSGFIDKPVIPKSHSCELYFEEPELETFVQKLETFYPSVQYVHRIAAHSGDQRSVRFYDPDGNLIEVRTPVITRPTEEL